MSETLPRLNPLQVADRVLPVIENVTRTHDDVEIVQTLGMVEPRTVSMPLTNLENCERETSCRYVERQHNGDGQLTEYVVDVAPSFRT